MKKKTISLKKLELKKTVIAKLTPDEQVYVKGGDGALKTKGVSISCATCGSAKLDCPGV